MLAKDVGQRLLHDAWAQAQRSEHLVAPNAAASVAPSVGLGVGKALLECARSFGCGEICLRGIFSGLGAGV